MNLERKILEPDQKRSRAVSSKQDLMSDHISPLSPTTKFTYKPTASLIPSPGFFVGFSPKGFSDTEASAVSPTSILEPKPFSTSGLNFSGRKPRASLNNSSETKHYPWDAADSKTVGLGILDALSHEKADKESSNVDSKKVFFGSQLKVQIPSDCQNSVFQTGSVVSPHSLIEFGVKNKNSQLAMALFSPARRSSLAAASPTSEPSPPVLCISASGMELSEDYTRVVSHGPNPRTTHIFYTCIMGSCSNGFSPLRGIMISTNGPNGHPYDDFLAFCNACRKKLGQGKDIFMYRGEKAFCSQECRNREMVFDDGMDNSAHCKPPAP